MNSYKIYPPCKRVVNVGGKEFYYSFPSMIFWNQGSTLYCGYVEQKDEESCILSQVISSNVAGHGVCLGNYPNNFYSTDLNKLIEKFWQTKFETLKEPKNLDTIKAKLFLKSLEIHTPGLCFVHARDVIEGRWLEMEEIIKTSPYYSCLYAKDVIKDRWIEGEKTIKTSPEYSCYYSKHVVRGRWLEGEETIKTNLEMTCLYARYIIKGRWLEAEDIIKTNPYYIYYYAIYVIKGRWLEAEEILKNEWAMYKEYENYLNEQL